MSEITAQGYYLITDTKNSIISVERDDFVDDKDKRIEAIEIRIDAGKDNELELQLRLPIDGLKKILIAGKKFLETEKAACFYFDKFIIGNIGEDRKEISAKEALKSV